MRGCVPFAESCLVSPFTWAVLLCTVVLAGCDVATVRKLDPATGKAIIEEDQKLFDARTWVAENWDARVLPSVQERSVELSELQRALASDSAAATKRSGNRAGSGSVSFLVRGTARVIEVDTTSRSGVAKLDLEPFDGSLDAQLQIGPVFRGTALRDALPFIRFDDFTNQMEYASVSRFLHERVAETVVGKVDRAGLAGQVVAFYGAFTGGSGRPLITPVILKVEG